MMRTRLLLLVGAMMPSMALADEATLKSSLSAIRGVGKEGNGNPAAAAGAKAVAAEGVAALVPTLEAFKGATPAAKNWLRLAVAGLADKENAAGRTLPADSLKTFVTVKTHDPSARAIAYDLYVAADPAGAKALLPSLIDDSSVEIRRLAIADRLAKAGDDIEVLKSLFDATRDKDQAEAIAKTLDTKGVKVDLTNHFGYILSWHLCGPFDSPEGVGFAKSFPAEAGYDPAKQYPGKGDKEVGWKTAHTFAKYGMVDLNKELGKNMDAVAYAATQFTSEAGGPCEIRVGSKNAVHIYLNGTKLFEREAYHHGYDMDQHVGVGTLKAGANEIVLKVVQNNQKDSWAQDWAFNLRVCDAAGGKLPIRSTMPPMPAAPPATPEVKK
jgi:hypothetical protein